MLFDTVVGETLTVFNMPQIWKTGQCLAGQCFAVKNEIQCTKSKKEWNYDIIGPLTFSKISKKIPKPVNVWPVNDSPTTVLQSLNFSGQFQTVDLCSKEMFLNKMKKQKNILLGTLTVSIHLRL